MAKSILIILFTCIMTIIQAQNASTIYPLKEDISTIDGIMKASYEVVSGEAGEIRQWERDLSLHHPKAIYSFIDTLDGKAYQAIMSLEDFHSETDTMVATTAFYESEIHREVLVFGNIAHVWSTYETRLEKDGEVVRRGINSIQLVYDQDRWWIISWIFDKEREHRKLPQTFLPN